MKTYDDVLMNKVAFYSTEEHKNVYLEDYRYWVDSAADQPLKPVRFTVMDMDGDHIPEIVLELRTGTDSSFEVLHYALQFTTESYRLTQLGYSESGSDAKGNHTVTYHISDKIVSDDDFYSFCSKQNEKPDAEWQDYNKIP